MWLNDAQMSDLGFRRKGERYWRCDRRHGLSEHDHVSVFCWSEQRATDGRRLVELTEFHVTFYRGEEKAFETTPLAVTEGIDPKTKAIPLRFTVPLANMPVGRYDVHVSVREPQGQKAAFGQAPSGVVP